MIIYGGFMRKRKGNSKLLQEEIESIWKIMQIVQTHLRHYNSVEEVSIIKDKLEEIEYEIHIMLIRWEAKEQNSIGIFQVWKARSKIKYLKQCEMDIQELMLEYELIEEFLKEKKQ